MDLNNKITEEEINKAKKIINDILIYYNSKVVGQQQLGVSILAAMITNGHILLESVPGLAKTTAAKVMTEAVQGIFSRIQCTPDLIPSDIIGTQTYNAQTNTFENKLGPVYGNFVLLDEVNRSSAKTQSAMLEAMQDDMARGHTPSVKADKRCAACSMKEICLPGLRRSPPVAAYLRRAAEEGAE